MKRFTNRQGIGERYQISLGTVKNLMRRRVLPFVKIGRIVRFNIEKCDQAMAVFESKSVALFATEEIKS